MHLAYFFGNATNLLKIHVSNNCHLVIIFNFRVRLDSGPLRNDYTLPKEIFFLSD